MSFEILNLFYSFLIHPSTHLTLQKIYFYLYRSICVVQTIHECVGYSLRGSYLCLSQHVTVTSSSASWGGIVCSVSALCWDLVWIHFSQVLHMMVEPLLVHMCSCLAVFIRCFFVVICCFRLLGSFCPFGLWSKWMHGWDVYVPFKTEYSVVSISLHLDQLEVIVLITIYFKYKLLRRRSKDAQISWYNQP